MKASALHLPFMSRRSLLQLGAAMVVGFGASSREAQAQFGGPSAKGSKLDGWLVVHEDNTASIYMGRTEFGQGTLTGMLQIAAEELDLDMNQVKAIPLQTGRTVNQGAQVSSSSIEQAAPNLRMAAAEARHALLMAAARQWGVAVDTLDIRSGIISTRESPPRKISYGQLLGGRKFNLEVTGSVQSKQASAYRIVGVRVPRVDTPAKAAGAFEYMQYVKMPGMLHGRVVRPPGQAGGPPTVRSIDEASISHLPGVRVVRIGDFVGVVAPNEWHAVKAASQLRVDWQVPASLPKFEQLQDKMRSERTNDSVLEEKGDPPAAFAGSTHQVTASFFSPYESHAPFGPNCALADVRADFADVVCSTQSLYPTRSQLAKLLGMRDDQVRVRHAEGAGTYGHSCYDDVAQAAVLLSRAVTAPVRVQFSRQDEIGWDNYGPAHASDIRASADRDGKLTSYEYHGWQHGWYPAESSAVLAQGTKIEKLWVNQAGVVNRVCAASMYATAHRRIANHDIPGTSGYLKGSFLRAPLDLSIAFGSEQVIDELAFRTGLDPIEFRKRNIADPRWLGVLEAVATASAWKPSVANSDKGGGRKRQGRGVGMGTHFVSFGAAVAHVEVDIESGEISVKHLYGALDAGLIVNPALVEQQIEGMMVQAASRVLHEQIRFDERGVTSLDWGTYPILRFNESPDVTAIAISRPEYPSTGAGEEVLAATGAAIANAFYDATGHRLKERPMTPDRVLAALGTTLAGLDAVR